MRLINSFRTSVRFIFPALIFILAGQLANAEYVILESATMGPTGQDYGALVDDTQFVGWRFYVSRYLKVTKIGGHIAQGVPGGNFFGAIVSLGGSSDLPNGYPFTAGEVVASTVFDPGYLSRDYRASLSVKLHPGTYGLVFGTDALGSSNGYGIMPTGGQTSYPLTSYFVFWPGYGWLEIVPNDTRFVVEGNTVYCDATGSNLVEYQYIMGVQVGSINNIPTDNHHYADYTSLSTNMEPETSYPVTITRGNPWDDVYDKCGLWVDWNQDMDFYDYGEGVPMSLGVDPCTFTGTITPPAGAVLGNTCMRIRITWNEVPQPCGDSSYGEVEDYTINVSTAPSFVTVSGYVKSGNGIGIKDVLVSFSTGGTDTTDVDGHYERTLSSPWSGTITPGKSGWAFEPADRSYVNLTTDVSNADFTAAHAVYGGGKGTAADPYLIFTASQMNTIGLHYVDWHSHFKLMADIDLGGYTGDSFNIIGGNLGKFEGVFDGNGKRIHNFTFTSVFPDIHIKGIFKHLDGANAEIKDLGLVNPNLNGGTGTEVGVLVGRLSGGCSVSGCYVEGGSVSGGSTVGGLVGSVDNGTISNCYATCDVWGNNDNVGGLIGANFHAITNCYSIGKVAGGGPDIGGLIGLTLGGTVISCFWDVDRSEQYVSSGGTGLPTAEMQMQSTYTNAGWDFSTPVWEICDGTNYPKLAWQIPLPGDFVCPDGVDFFDYSFFAEQWAEGNCGASNDCNGRDLDKLGSVDFEDLGIFVDNWLTGQ